MRTARMLIVGGVVAALFSLFSRADAAQQSQKGACKADVQKLCKDVQPGEGKILECLKTHQAEVSAPCASHIKQVQGAMKQVSQACEPDVEKYCFDAPIGKGGIASCLKKHSNDLSADCKAAVASVKQKK